MSFLLMLSGLAVFAFVFAFSMWSLGGWLRKKGYGHQLEKFGRWYEKHISRGPNLDAFQNVAGSFKSLPLFGNKQKTHIKEK
ncbi:hypothetical protein NRA16_17800 [Acinetobacter baumannii]|nr:hypothetical protein [Acinetobacter baumannii]